MRVVGTAATFLTVVTLLVGCDGRVNHVDASHVDPGGPGCNQVSQR